MRKGTGSRLERPADDDRKGGWSRGGEDPMENTGSSACCIVRCRGSLTHDMPKRGSCSMTWQGERGSIEDTVIGDGDGWWDPSAGISFSCYFDDDVGLAASGTRWCGAMA